LARRIPHATIYAYDIDPEAQRLCIKNAELNGVLDRVRVGEFFALDELPKMDVETKGIIICDCEGCEVALFNEDNIDNFKNWDLIIETHDFMDINISSHLTRLFSKTHDIRSVLSIDDIQKAKTYDYPELDDFDLFQRRQIVEECRPAIIEWLNLKSRKSKKRAP
jgi:hypothetical protein